MIFELPSDKTRLIFRYERIIVAMNVLHKVQTVAPDVGPVVRPTMSFSCMIFITWSDKHSSKCFGIFQHAKHCISPSSVSDHDALSVNFCLLSEISQPDAFPPFGVCIVWVWKSSCEFAGQWQLLTQPLIPCALSGNSKAVVWHENEPLSTLLCAQRPLFRPAQTRSNYYERLTHDGVVLYASCTAKEQSVRCYELNTTTSPFLIRFAAWELERPLRCRRGKETYTGVGHG
mmetsp:Transcript_4822/g.14531  ORF Transcript_4822/g.14531 Transcript_4822/m.14531 type:complete len:231 (+) Transcript_4822:2144-2836(+)